MKRLAHIFSAIFCITFLSGCGRRELVDEKIDNVVRVFMHQPSEYSLLVSSANSKELTLRHFRWLNKVLLYEDVLENQKMWAKLIGYRDTVIGDNLVLEIHLHSANDLDGGGWNRGKGGRGQTQVIE